MRGSWLVVFLVATAIPLSASKHTTVAQLQQALNTAINAHKPDTEIAREIGGFDSRNGLRKLRWARSKYAWFRDRKGRELSNCLLTNGLSSTRRQTSCRRRQLRTAQSKLESCRLREDMFRKRCLAYQTFSPPG